MEDDPAAEQDDEDIVGDEFAVEQDDDIVDDDDLPRPRRPRKRRRQSAGAPIQLVVAVGGGGRWATRSVRCECLVIVSLVMSRLFFFARSKLLAICLLGYSLVRVRFHYCYLIVAMASVVWCLFVLNHDHRRLFKLPGLTSAARRPASLLSKCMSPRTATATTTAKGHPPMGMLARRTFAGSTTLQWRGGRAGGRVLCLA